MSYVAAGIAAAGAIGSTAITASGGHKNRKAARDIARENREAQWEMWDATNAYNAPTAQRERLEKAGLNPHLVYGNGATTLASNQNLPDAQAPNYDEYATMGQQISQAGNSVMEYKLRSAQVNDLNESIEVKKEQQKLLNAQTLKTLTGNDTDEFGLGVKRELRDTYINEAKAKAEKMNLQETWQRIKNSQMDEAHKAIMNESAERINNLKLEGNYKKINNELEGLRLKLRRGGVEVNDNFFMRMLAPILAPIKATIQYQSEKHLKPIKG